MENDDELIEITYDEVRDFMDNNKHEFNAQQAGVSFPIIQRIHRRYQQGHTFSEIEVIKNKTVSDGHHRFISLSLLNVKLNTIPAGENMTKRQPLSWSDVKLDAEDWDSWAYRRHYEKRYDNQEKE